MLVLDNSSSMLDFPNPLPFPSTWPASGGTCSGTSLNDFTSLATPTPYDNGYTTTIGTSGLTDSPSWGLASCTAANSCLFRGTSYYMRHPGAPDGWIDYVPSGWTTSTATEQTLAQACSSTRVDNTTECQNCLASSGYYLFRDKANSNKNNAVFTGAFLNGYPPKFVIARKVMKDIISLDDGLPSALDNVRFGLTILNPYNGSSCGIGSSFSDSYDGGSLIVPLGPDCADYPMTNALQEEPRQAIIDALNDPDVVYFYRTGGIGTPLAETLFNVGQYFTAVGTSGKDSALFSALFGNNNNWTSSAFKESAGGAISASWAGGDQHSICWKCQQSSIVLVTDGQPMCDDNLPKGTSAPGSTHSTIGTAPNGDFVKWGNPTIDCPGCGNDDSNGKPNLLHKVAYLLNHTDLRSDSFTIGSGASATNVSMDGNQNVTTYTISFGLDPVRNPDAFALLQKTADLGGGIFANSTDGDSLNQAIYNAVTDVVSRATSFSNANTATLQTAGRANQIFLTRFSPHSGPSWEGHVYRFQLFYEYAQFCVEGNTSVQVACQKYDHTTKLPSGTKMILADLNQDGACDGLFKLDADCDPVVENDDGEFVKAQPNASHTMVPTASPGTPAVPIWDGGDVLSDSSRPGYRTAAEPGNAATPVGGHTPRLIYTVVDKNSDGRFTSADGLTPFVTAKAGDIAPLMQLDPSWCLGLFERIGRCGPAAPLPVCPTVATWDTAPVVAGVTNTELCANQIIYYVRGYDVLDQDGDGCAGPDNPGNDSTSCAHGEERDRANDDRTEKEFWKLGDIFHSSPILVEPPIDETTCDYGLHTQCVATIHSPQALTLAIQTPMDCGSGACDLNGDGDLDPGEDAYSAYRRDNLSREAILLVGANDGMLHAFDAGTGDQINHPGNGEELWAFIPPDLLPKLQNALDAHDYFVDGDVMVRDIWHDDDANGRKAPGEFRTLAVMSERSGGSAYAALDVTDTRNPALRWVFPQLCTQDVNLLGQSWTGFAPRAPPVGPVQIKSYAGGPLDPTGREFEERWIVALAGGYDPSLTRGKGVWIVDAWTGSLVWRYTNDEFQTDILESDKGAMWPVAASPGLVDTGKSGDATANFDGFFDTLTFTDIGGQIWTARLDPPGEIGANGRVTNWVAARAFEEQRQTDDSQEIAGRSEFYFMTANAVDSNPETHYLHTYVGSGNREHILQVGAGCGPDNVLGCCQGGCNVADVTTHFNYGGGTDCDVQQHFKCQGGTLTQDKSQVSGTCETFTCADLNANIQLHLNCGSAGNPPDIIAHLRCDADGNCCETIGDGSCVKVKKGKNLNPSKLTQPTTHNRFYGVWSYGGPRAFATTAAARTFDQNRFTDIAYAGTCLGSSGSCTLVDTTQAQVNLAGGVTPASAEADGYDPGWFYEYGQVCPLQSCSPLPPWLDEKTGSPADVMSRCIVWNTFRPFGAGVSLAPCTVSSGAPQNYNYVADAISGAPSEACGHNVTDGSDRIVRASSRQAIAPPLSPTMLVSILGADVGTSGGSGGGTGGTVQTATGQPGDPGASQPGGDRATVLGGSRSLSESGYWLEVPRDLHQCRHVDPAFCQ